MRRLLIFALSFLSGCYDSADAPAEERRETTVNATLADLRRLYAGIPFEVTGDIVVAGCVTSSDEGRNFYGSLVVEDGGAAVEIMTGTDRLFNRYPPGCRLAVRLRGLTVAEQYGVLQLGRKPAPGSGYATDYLGSQAAVDRVVVRTGGRTEPEACVVRCPELTQAMCGRLVRFERMRYAPDGLDDALWGGYRRFVEASVSDDELTDDTPAVYVYTRSYADWAGVQVPLRPLALTGILQYGKADGRSGRYLLKPRCEHDLEICD